RPRRRPVPASMPSPAGPAARFRRKPCRRGSSPPGWLLPSPCASAPRTPARACLPPRGTCVLFPRSRARGAPPPPCPALLLLARKLLFLRLALLLLFPGPALLHLARLAQPFLFRRALGFLVLLAAFLLALVE